MKLSIIIPVYNESRTLQELVEKVLELELPNKIAKEIIIVDDGSSDASGEIMTDMAKKYKEIKIIKNAKNLGKSQTVKNGIAASTGDFVIIQDADLEYLPSEIADLLKIAIESDLDVVYGNRFGKNNKVIYWQNYLGNCFLSFLTNLFTFLRIKIYIPDIEVCYKLIKGDIARKIGKSIESTSSFGFEPEVTAKLSKYKKNGLHLKFGIVPVSYFPRTVKDGKKIKLFKDGLRAILEIVKFNL